MNKRTRKKHRKKALHGLLALCSDQETMRDLVLHKALTDVVNAYKKSPEDFSAAFQRYTRTVRLWNPEVCRPSQLQQPDLSGMRGEGA